MKSTRLLAVCLAAMSSALLLAVQAQPPAGTPPQQQPAQQPTQQPGEIRVAIVGTPGQPPRLAVPDFIPLSNDAETVRAAKTIGQVLFDDLAYEREFYMIGRDILRTVPQPTSVDQVSIARWKEVGADGVVIGSVRRTGDGVVVEFRLLQLPTGEMKLGKQYSGSLNAITRDGGRLFAHTIADELHKQQFALRGVARTRLVFSSDRDGARMKGPVAERDISNIYMSDYDGENQTRLTATRSLDITPTWAPDGKAIAYTSYRTGFQDIYVQFVGGAVRQLANPAQGTSEKQNYLPVWSPDGTRLAFTSNRDGNPEIYVMNRDGSGLRRLTNNPSIDVTPTWAPTGAQIAFTSDRTGNPQIYIVNVDGTGLQRITTESYCDRPTWSPAPFNEIAYASRGGGGYQIMVFDFATRSTRAITDGIGSNESPAFAPNGRHVAFVSDRTGRPQIYTIDRDGNNLRPITRLGGSRYPNWSYFPEGPAPSTQQPSR